MSEVYVGFVFHYYSDIKVAILKLTDRLAVGDQVRFHSPRGKSEGQRVDFTQLIESLQIDRQPVEMAESGRMVAVRVHQKVRKADEVYKITNEELL